MAYTVEYNGECYELFGDGRVEPIPSPPIVARIKVDADVIANWGYVHKLIHSEELGGIMDDHEAYFTVVPGESTICIKFSTYLFRQYSISLNLDVDPVRTTMRRKFATFVESIKKFVRDLSFLIDKYYVSVHAGSGKGLIVDIESFSDNARRRRIVEGVIDIDRRTGVYTTNVWKIVKENKHNLIPKGINYTFTDGDSLTFTHSGVKKLQRAPWPKYFMDLEDEWPAILKLMIRLGFRKNVTISSEVEFTDGDRSIRFSNDTSDSMYCEAIYTRFRMTGRGDVERLIKCIASSRVADQVDRQDARPSRLMIWDHDAHDAPWRLILKSYLRDENGQVINWAAGETVMIVDAGRIVYDRR